MAELVIMENTISQYGLRELHVIWMGGPKDGQAGDLATVQAQIPAEAEDVLFARRYEAELGIWHLQSYWNAREPVMLQIDGAARPAVMWKVSGRLSWSVDLAATCFRMRLGKWPETAVARSLPAGCPDRLTVRDESGEALVRLQAAKWAPEGFVVVM